MSFESLKLNKQIITALEEVGITEPREVQAKTISRILGGQDLVVIGPEGCGKTTTLIVATIAKLKYAQDPPRALILTSSKEKVLELVEQFNLLAKNTDLRVVGIYPGPGIEGQKEALAEGADIIIGTPDKTHALYLKSGINTNKINLFLLDDTESIIHQGFQSLVVQMADRLPKCQHLVFSEVIHGKLELLLDKLDKMPVFIEISELGENMVPVIPHELFHVPNFKTKLNLLKLMVQDNESFNKCAIIVNTKLTLETVLKNISPLRTDEIAILSRGVYEAPVLTELDDFLNAEELKILLIANEEYSNIDVTAIPEVIHFDIPENRELLIERIASNEEDNEEGEEDENEENRIAFILATDLELSNISKIEQAIGQKLNLSSLPEDLNIVADKIKEDFEEEKKVKKPEPSEKGAAFHEKKASNAKDYNLKYKDRLKMFGKKHRKHKRGEK